jgi:hypothetical protein
MEKGKKLKKFLVGLVAMTLMLLIISVNNAQAAQTVAKVVTKDNKETEYASLKEAQEAMKDGDTLYLLADSSEKIEVPSEQNWKVSAGSHVYSGGIGVLYNSTLEFLDGRYEGDFHVEYTSEQSDIIFHDGVIVTEDTKQIVERFERNDQWCRPCDDGTYVVETTDYLPYKVNGQLYASSERATRDIADGDTLYIVKDTDRGISGLYTGDKRVDIDAGDCKVSGGIYYPLKTKLISGIFSGETTRSSDLEITFGEKCRYTKGISNQMRELCAEDEKVIQDEDGYYVVVPATESDKIVSVNGKSYISAEKALKAIGKQNATITFSADYNDYIEVPYTCDVRLDFGEHSMNDYIDNFGATEIVSGNFDGYIYTARTLTISGGYFGNAKFDYENFGNNPRFVVKGGTFTKEAYEQIKDDIADGYKAVYQNGNYVVYDKDYIVYTGWQKIGGKWYYYNSNGEKTTGWQRVGGKWYYMNGSGAMTTGWQRVGGKWYYMNGSGVMTTGWQRVGGKWYYMNSSGVMTTGWQKVGGKWYYMNGSGVMTTGWQKVGSKWYYMNGSGIMTTGWQKVGGKWYYMNGSGVMTTGWQKIGGKRYYMNASGVWVK